MTGLVDLAHTCTGTASGNKFIEYCAEDIEQEVCPFCHP